MRLTRPVCKALRNRPHAVRRTAWAHCSVALPRRRDGPQATIWPMATLNSTGFARVRSVLTAGWLLLLLMAASAVAQDKQPVILVVGDSVSAAYGLANGQGWVALLGAKLKSEGFSYNVVN